MVDDLDHLLAWVERLAESSTNRLLANACNYVAHDTDVDVGLEQRRPNLGEHLVDIGLRQATATAKLLDDAFKAR